VEGCIISPLLAPAISLLAALCLSGVAHAQNFQIDVASPNARALQSAIDKCPRGYGSRTKGCQIRLPSGTIRGAWKIGGKGSAALQVGVCLVGQGAGHGSTTPGGKPGAAGTTLVYEGPPGGVLLDFAGGDFPCLKNLSLAMHGAAVGVRFRAEPGTPIQNPILEHVSIAGDKTRPGGIGIQITDSQENGQVDALLAEGLKINFVDVGIEVNSHQAVTNRIGPGSKITGQRSAVRLLKGSLSLDGVLAQCRTANCCTYDLDLHHGYFRVRDGYHEIGLDPARNAALLCLPHRNGEGVGSAHMVSLSESYVNVQCNSSLAPCAVDLVRGRSNTVVVLRDNWIYSAGGPGNRARRRARVSLDGATRPARLVWSGNGSIPLLAALGPKVAVEAFRSDGATSWNDLDLDGVPDPNEPRMTSAREAGAPQ